MEAKTDNSLVTVLGCGVLGLTSAVRILERGYRVQIVARELPPATTSDVAAAIWHPFKASPPEKVAEWARASYRAYRQLASVPGTGVRFVDMDHVFAKPEPEPWWVRSEYRFRRLPPDQLPNGYVDGFRVEVPLIETPLFMPYLMRRFLELGGTVLEKSIDRIDTFCGPGRPVVNCTGLGAGKLVNDPETFPIRGQVVKVKTNGVSRFISDESLRLAYVLPRSVDCVLGGTVEPNRWDLTPDPQTTEDILERCRHMVPDLQSAVVLKAQVGLRPGRSRVRLEAQGASNGTGLLIHNYGHGGSGFTLCWGCADDVVGLLGTASGSSSGG